MNDKLTNKKRITVHQGGGLHARIASNEIAKEVLPPEVKPDPLTKEHRIVLMMDCSGSMSSEIGGGGFDRTGSKSKIQILQDAVQDFVAKADFFNTSIALESFPEGTRCSLSIDKPMLWMFGMGLRAEGGTPLGQCLRFVKDYPLTRGVIISDGEATDLRDLYEDGPEEGTPPFGLEKHLESYLERRIPIDTIHIGDSKGGEDLLRSIAELTGGMYIKFTDALKLSEKLHFLLPETRDLLGLPEYKAKLDADEVS
jgi:hypothetical protein